MCIRDSNFANESLIRELLPVIDNLERALQHGEQEVEGRGLVDGVRLTLKGFTDVLGRFGCSSFEAVGKVFDPNYHEAVMQQESSEYPDTTVVQELQKGYTLRDRLVPVEDEHLGGVRRGRRLGAQPGGRGQSHAHQHQDSQRQGDGAGRGRQLAGGCRLCQVGVSLFILSVGGRQSAARPKR